MFNKQITNMRNNTRPLQIFAVLQTLKGNIVVVCREKYV